MGKPRSTARVYVCRCGPNLAEHLDLDRIAQELAKDPAVSGVALHDTLCTPQGQAFLLEDLAQSGAESFAIVGCSPREHEATFRKACRDAGRNPYLFAMANVREQCAWVSGDRERATRKAIDLGRAAAARAAHQRPLEEREVPANADALIIGSGVAGLTAARALAEAGRKVVLVEREACAGGRVAVLADLFPALECASCMLDPLLDDVVHHENVELLTLTEVESVFGRRGAFTIRLRRHPRRVDAAGCYGCATCHEVCPAEAPSRFDQGAVHKAIHIPYTGAVPHVSVVDAAACLYVRDGSCGACVAACPFGNLRLDEQEEVLERRVGAVIIATGDEPEPLDPSVPPRVVSAYALERLINEAGPTQGEVKLPDGTVPKTVAFLRCAGSDGAGPIERCSGLCCALFDKYAALLRKRLPDVQIFDLGPQSLRSTRPAHGHVTRLTLAPGGGYRLVPAEGRACIQYATAAGTETLAVDLVVVAPPLRASEGTREIARRLGLDCDPDGYLLAEHARLRPFASRVEGFYLAGSAQGSKDVPSSATQGLAAAGAVLSILQPGKTLRLDPQRAEVDPDRCSGCGICAEVCPYQAVGPAVAAGAGQPGAEGERKVSQVDADRCHGCGCCAAACPSHAIRAPNFSEEELEAELEALLP